MKRKPQYLIKNAKPICAFNFTLCYRLLKQKRMELTDLYKKLNNLFDLQERRDLTSKEEKELNRLKKLRNRLDPEWHKKL